MELLFVGTSSGKTSLSRFHSSLLFKIDSKNILIDAGDGISKALLNQNISANEITDIIFSHYHSDHLAGLSSLLTQMIISKRTETLRISTHFDLIKMLKQFLEISYIFIEKLDFKIEIIGYNFSEQILLESNFIFFAKQNSHIRNKHNIETEFIKFISSSFLFSVNSTQIIYTSDVSQNEDLYLFKEANPKIFITETTHIDLNEIENVVDIFPKSKIYLTHIEDEEKLLNWYSNLSNSKKEEFVIAEDGMKIEL